ncbi:hypothetical protein GOP47_0008750 [Adiantum capillus-veneris]|uniref:Protein kinase domain-containing protein n=1 Tax=Adiantum capillus-veneris TaxID=13818 RepID=A0A9D4UZK3_ADICA|nr:hypothetical protein GOP47_0008750 [Adiantum capillus-veneris]
MPLGALPNTIIIINTFSLYLVLATLAAAADIEDAIFLYKFKNAIKEDPSQVLYSWRLESPAGPCDWTGVECDVSVLKTGVPVVRGISLPYKDILGTLWQEIGRLRFLKTLNLTGNRFQGQVPSYINNVIVLETLDLSNNAFTGVLPPLQKLTYLKTLLLSNNQLEGDFPGAACDGDALRIVDLSNNKMTGIISKDVFKCSKLEVLKLSENALHGVVPSTLGELTHLRVFDLSGNQLTGSLPEAIGQMQYLTQLLLSDNQFTGFITPSISSATYLVTLDLSNNQIGKGIPESLGSLAFLEHLSLSNNKLQGAIPQTIGKLTSLVSLLDLSDNMLSGSIPSSIGNLERLQKMDLSNNRLSEAIPDIWGSFYSLKTLDLSSNRFSGSLPVSMQGFSNIQFLNLSHNELVGGLPIQISSLTTLSVMDLSYNSLTGSIPDWFGSLTSLSYFDGSHNGLVGSLPASLENLTYIDVFDVSYNELSGLLVEIPLFRRFAESGYLNNERGLCGPVLNVTCSSAPNVLGDLGTEVYKFLKSREEKLKYLPIFIMATLGVGIVLVLVMCLLLQSFRPKIYEEVVEYCQVVFSPLLNCCGKKKRFSYNDLRLATEHFCNRSVIGFGLRYKVFWGQLTKDQNFAIKVLSRDFLWQTKPHFLIVYKYMPKGSLDDVLYGRKTMGSLTWEERLGIALDVARGLAYLQQLEKEKRRIYCHLCPSNILLDQRCGAKIGGLRLIRERDPTIMVEGVLNKKPETRPDPKDFVNYLAPECVDEKHMSDQAEVYSFGLTILELITRKRSAIGVLSLDKSLPAKMRQLFPDRVKQFVDIGILRTTTDSNQVLTLIGIALSCTEEDPVLRPTMESVVSALTWLKKGEVDMNQPSQHERQANMAMPGNDAAFHTFQEDLFTQQNMFCQDTPSSLENYMLYS